MKKLIAAIAISFSLAAGAVTLKRFKNDVVITGSTKIGASTAADSSSVLDLESTTRGFLPPRHTTTQRDAISTPATGLSLFNSTTGFLNLYNGSSWKEQADTDSTQTFSGKSISGSTNTLTNLPDSSLTESYLKADGTRQLTGEWDTGATFGLLAPTYKSKSSNLSTVGTLRLSNSDSVGWRNVGNTADLELKPDSTDGVLLYNGIPLLGSNLTQIVSGKSIDADANTITNIENADIKAGAAIVRSKLATGTINRALVNDGSGNITESTVTSTELGHLSGVTSAVQTQIDGKQASDGDLTALSGLSGTGVVARTAADTYAERTIAGTTDQISLTNGNGVSGNPTVALASDPVLPGTGAVQVPSGTSAQRPGTPTNGDFRYNTDDGKFEGYQGGAWGELGGGSGSGSSGINYISSNADAEVDTTGWSTYEDSSGDQPADGTGGTAGFTFSRTTTTPLRGTGSFEIDAGLVNRQGQGVSFDFTVDNADKASVLQLSFDYESLNFYADDYVRIFIYDVTNSNLIEPVPVDLKDTNDTQGKFLTEFQTAPDSTSYRLIFHIATTQVNWKVEFDNVELGPGKKIRGPPRTDLKDFTPTGSWTTNTTYTGNWLRDGDVMRGNIYISLSGAPNATGLTVNLPSGFSIDTGKVKDTTANSGSSLGDLRVFDSGVSNLAKSTVIYSSTTSLLALALNDGSAEANSQSQITNTVPITFASGDKIHIRFEVPIEGWSSSVQMSEDAGTREVALFVRDAALTPTLSGTRQTLVYNGSVEKDTHDKYNSTTGVWTAPESGLYDIYAQYFLSGTTAANDDARAIIYKNGTTDIARTIYRFGGVVSGNVAIRVDAPGVPLVAGDTIEIEASTGITSPVYSNSDSDHYFSIRKASGAQRIAASELVTASYQTNAGAGIGNATTTIVDFEDKMWDSHNAVTTGSSWKFTAPVAGTYSVKSFINFGGSTGWELDEYAQLYLYKEGSEVSRLDDITFISSDASANSPRLQLRGSALVQLESGEEINIRVFHNSDGTETLNATGLANQVHIHRIGF